MCHALVRTQAKQRQSLLASHLPTMYQWLIKLTFVSLFTAYGLSQSTITPDDGVLVASIGNTYAVAAYFTNDGGPSTSSICRLAKDSNGTCDAFRPAIKTAIAMILQSLKDSNSSSIAVGDTNVQPMDTVPQKRYPQSSADIKGLLDFMGQEHGEVTVAPSDAKVSQRDIENTTVSVQGINAGNISYNLALQGSGTSQGHVLVVPYTTRKRAVDSNTSVKPDAQPQNLTASSSPGFKITFATKAQNVIPGSLTLPDKLSALAYLSEAMASDWGDRASVENGSRYIAIYGQTSRVIVALEIIPEIRGYGLNQEDPNSYCGPLDGFACRGNTTCLSECPQANSNCSPLTPGSQGSSTHTGSSSQQSSMPSSQETNRASTASTQWSHTSETGAPGASSQSQAPSRASDISTAFQRSTSTFSSAASQAAAASQNSAVPYSSAAAQAQRHL